MKKILTLVFLVSLSVAAFATWSVQHTVSGKELYAIDGVTTASLARLCAVGNSGYVVLSTDYGSNWTPASGSIAGTPNLRGVAIGTDYLYVAGGGKCFFSNNWGTSWSDRSTDLPSTINDVDFGNSSKGVIVGSKIVLIEAAPTTVPVVMYTTNGGSNWTNTTPAAIPSANAVHFENEDEVWIVGGGGNVWKSENGGSSWTQKALTGGGGTITSATLYDIDFYDASHGFIVGSSNNFLWTTDGGETWTLNTSALSSGDNFGVHAVDANTVWVVGEDPDTIISKVTKVADWSATTEHIGTSGEHFYKVFLTDADNGWVAGYGPAGGAAPTPYGEILSQITPFAITNVVRNDLPDQTTIYPEGAFTMKLSVVNSQRGIWNTNNIQIAGSDITATSLTRVSKEEILAGISTASDAVPALVKFNVYNTDGSSASSFFDLVSHPKIDSMLPDTGKQGETITATAYGEGFLDDLTAKDITANGGVVITDVDVRSRWEMVITQSLVGASVGPVSYTISSPNADVFTSTNVFAVTSDDPSVINPVITSFVPEEGLTQGDTNVRFSIHGNGFDSTAATVSFSNPGINIDSYIRLGSTQLDCILTVASDADTGSGNFTLTNPDGGLDRMDRLFVETSDAGTMTITNVLPTFVYQGTTAHSYIDVTGLVGDEQVYILPPASGGTPGITLTDVVSNPDKGGINCTVNAAYDAVIGTRDILVFRDSDGAHTYYTDKFLVKAQGAKPAIEDKKGWAGPNPSTDPSAGIGLFFELTKDDQLKLLVVNSAGQREWEINTPATAGLNKVMYYGDTFTGKIANGAYLIPVFGSDGKRLANIILVIARKGPK